MLKTFQDLTTDALIKYDRPVPRYTSYPTAVQFKEIPSKNYRERLARVNRPLSIYIHIPFCEKMCLYCACSVVLNRREDRKVVYVDALIKEIELVSSCFSTKQIVEQLHFGGGTPTHLSCDQLQMILEKLISIFSFSKDAEISMEIDPRTVALDRGKKLLKLKKMGFNRVSFGVQDTNEKVQTAVRRRQSYEMTLQTFQWAKEFGFGGINIDLIYGLPFQTLDTFEDTVSKITEMKPDRIALFSYAKVPWLKPHQKAIKEKDLPTQKEKFFIYSMARSYFVSNGYVAIGMDHFSLEKDSMTKAYYEKNLIRNFQGYSIQKGEDLIGLGLSSIGFAHNLYVQNTKDLNSYYEMIKQNELPVFKGYALSEDDEIRKWVIHTLMCDFQLKKDKFRQKFNHVFNKYFAKELEELKKMQELVQVKDDKIIVTQLGELLIRIVVSVFDAYLQKSKSVFSRSI